MAPRPNRSAMASAATLVASPSREASRASTSVLSVNPDETSVDLYGYMSKAVGALQVQSREIAAETCYPVTALQNQLPEPPRQHEPCHAEKRKPQQLRWVLQCEDGDSNPDGC